MSDAPPPVKRYRREEVKKDDSEDEFGAEGEGYTPYVPVKERNKQKLMKLGRVQQIVKDEERSQSSTANSSEVL